MQLKYLSLAAQHRPLSSLLGAGIFTKSAKYINKSAVFEIVGESAITRVPKAQEYYATWASGAL